MLAYMLIVAIAYGVAYGITSTGINLWRAILGFALAFFVAWFGGSLLAVFLIELTQLGDAKNSFLPIIGRGSGWLPSHHLQNGVVCRFVRYDAKEKK